MKMTHERLVAAVIELWSEMPGTEISVRLITQRAGTAISAIDYHFGGLEHLYEVAHAHALKLAEVWIAARGAQLEPLAGARLGAQASAAVIAAAIDDWCEQQRPLATAWREACTLARGGGEREVWVRWSTLWRDFWKVAASALGMGEYAGLLSAFFAGEATQHMLRWDRTLDRALLDETVCALVGHLEGHAPRDAPVRAAYSARALREYGGLSDAGKSAGPALDAAAAQLLSEGGIAALTFRAVAERAGVTLGQTAYHFGSKTQLLKMAFEKLYQTAVGRQDPLRRLTGNVLFAEVSDAIASGQEPVLRALDAINMHISRDEGHHPLRGVIRGHPDSAASWVVESLLCPGAPVAWSLAAAFSSVCRGLDQIILGQEPATARKTCRTILLDFRLVGSARSAGG